MSLLKLGERGKKSLCAVKHANGGAGKNRQARYYLDFISRSLMISLLSISLLSGSSPPQLFLYFNGSEALTGCDCLIDRQIDISRWRRVHGRREQGAEDEVCVLSSTGTRSSVCLWRMMDYKGASGLCACVCVSVCGMWAWAPL